MGRAQGASTMGLRRNHRRQARPHGRRAGFTLVELMIVVAIVTVLSVVAAGAYRRYTNNARKTEVYALFAEIRGKEEAYRAEFSSYLNSSAAGETDLWPVLLGAGQGEPKAKPWQPFPGGSNWAVIGVNPAKSMVYCGYSIVAGVPAQAPTGALGLGAFPVAPTTFWWYAVAQCDNDGNGPPNATFVTASDRDTVFEQDPHR